MNSKEYYVDSRREENINIIKEYLAKKISENIEKRIFAEMDNTSKRIFNNYS